MPPIILILLAAFSCFPRTGSAMQDQTYGLGGSATGRVGGVTADPDNSFAALLNPALIPASPSQQFSFNLSRVNAQIQNPSGVVLDSRQYRTRDGQNRVGTADIPAVRTSLWSAGYCRPFSLPFWPSHRAGYGLAFSGPFDQFRRWLALSPYDFTPLRYGGADTQFKGSAGLGLELIPGALFLGGGLSLFLTSAGISEAAVGSGNATGRLAMDVGFNTAGIIGLYSRLGRYGLAAVIRQAVNPAFHQTMIANFNVWGNDIANQPTTIQSSLYYEPAVIELEMQKNWDQVLFSMGVSYQRWSGYEPRYLTVSTRDSKGANRGTLPAPTPMRDTWNPRASLAWRLLQSTTLSTGYQFRPYTVLDLSREANLIDTSTHVAAISLSRTFNKLLFFEKVSLTVYGQMHLLENRAVVKSSADFIGAPGYLISGRASVIGASLNADL